jgi:hypothetical protein
MQIEIIEMGHKGPMETVRTMSGQGLAVVMPTTDLGQATQAARRMLAYAQVPTRMVIAHDQARQGFIATINRLSEQLQPALLAYVAQDALAGQGWLKIAVECLQRERKSLLAFNDGKFAGKLASFGLVRTAFTRQLYGHGGIFHEGYHTHRADEELTHLAAMCRQLAYDPAALLMEVDYRLQRTVNAADSELYFQRKKTWTDLLASRFTSGSQAA